MTQKPMERASIRPQVRTEVENRPTIPVVVGMFEEIRTPDYTPQPWTEEHSLDTYFDSESKISAYFQEALSAWNYAFNESLVQDALESSDDEMAQEYLKLLRRVGLILRSSYKMFDGWHFEPESLANFIKKLGTSNDWIKHAETLLSPNQFLSDEDLYAIANEKFGFLPATEESFRAQVAKTVERIRVLTGSDVISIKDFHNARKSVRHLMNIIQIPACFEPGQPIHALFLEHYHLSQVMGEIHDQAVGATMGNSEAYAHIRVHMPPSLKANLEKICSHHTWAA